MNMVGTFLLRLVGVDPERKKVEAKLKESIDKYDEHDHKLDSILAKIEDVNTAAKMKRAELGQTVTSIRAASPLPMADESEITTKYGIPR